MQTSRTPFDLPAPASPTVARRPITAKSASGAKPDAAPPLPAIPPELVAFSACVSELIEGAARCLGAGAEEARQIVQEGAMLVGDLPMIFVPVPEGMGCAEGLMLLVDTGRPVEADGAAGMTKVLSYAAGLMPTHLAGVSASPEGCWTVHRLLELEGMTADSMAREMQRTRGLADALWAAIVG